MSHIFLRIQIELAKLDRDEEVNVSSAHLWTTVNEHPGSYDEEGS